MKTFAFWPPALFTAFTLAAAQPAEELAAAAKKLADSGNYAWTTTTESSGTSTNPPRRTVTEGKVAKDGTVYLTIPRYGQKMEALIKGNKGAYKLLSEWQGWNSEPEGGGATNRFRTGSRSMFNSKTPAVEAGELLSKALNLKKQGADIAGEFSAEEAGHIALMGVRIRTAVFDESASKGTIRFFIKDGLLAGYEYHVKAVFNVGGSQRKVERTVKVEISEIGKAAFEIPAEARKFL